jgi:hypothetical protein
MFTQQQIAAIMQAFQAALQTLAGDPTAAGKGVDVTVGYPVAPVAPVALPVAPPAWTAGIPAGFDEGYYLQMYPDVANAVRAGFFTSGAHHYVLHGKSEGRSYAQRMTDAPIVAGPIVKLAPVTTSPQITHSAGPNGWRVDDPAQPGTPGTVTLPVTGHTLSLPQPNPADPARGEMFVGYVARVHKQAGSPTFPAGLGGLFQGVADLFMPGRPWDAAGTYWPEAADRYYNRLAYETPYEKELRLRATQQWNEYDAEKKRQAQERAAGGGKSELHDPRPHGGTTTPPAPPVGEDVPIG